MTATISARERLVDTLKLELIGPRADLEVLSSRPSDVYLTGILYPPATALGDDQNEKLGAERSVSPEGDGSEGEDEAPLDKTTRPSAAGLSFAVAGENPQLSFEITGALYRAKEGSREAGTKRQQRTWARDPFAVIVPMALIAGSSSNDTGVPDLELFVKVSPGAKSTLVTAVLVNRATLDREAGRVAIEEHTFFQISMKVIGTQGTSLVQRPARFTQTDDDSRASALLYRNAKEFATGHTCSATWEEAVADLTTSQVATTWMPASIVPTVSAAGSKVFDSLLQADAATPVFSAEWLSTASNQSLKVGLEAFAAAYETWISEKLAEASALPADLALQATKHMQECALVLKRIREAATFLTTTPDALIAFQLANKAMNLQQVWKQKNPLQWRPFQLGFLLLALTSTASPDHPDRSVMDLLWFPTGGGKTEAYLGLIAFVMFYRRLRHKDPDLGAGTVSFMRYTLRLLTLQQFERAAAVILASDLLRVTAPATLRKRLGEIPFSLGLWVGSGSVPNKFDEARSALATRGSASSPEQLKLCPCCKGKLLWWADAVARQVFVKCQSKSCDLQQLGPNLPLWTVDEDVYRIRPSLLIATIDKFAQITRRREAGVFFGIGVPQDPPDLILQDELHLISGPLGTMAGIYEIAVDYLCSRLAKRPKIIGSTATIRHAENQIRALFDRSTCQFPPPGVSAEDSCFAVQDDGAPGRLYVGLSTVGRSAKFTLQAAASTLLQAAKCLPSAEQDAYWTLVAYFNSLRELGGALVLMQDDVPQTIEQLARLQGVSARKIPEVSELTSRVSQAEIRDMLSALSQPMSVDVLLASNMISVGVDIPRLGLMLVNGQPKSISEYIQATSRVGRGTTQGLILSVYNAGKPRDRSHFETFRTWHQTLYREVDATGVTPFASRARDRALRAAVVAMVRHSVPNMVSLPDIKLAKASEIASLKDEILRRAKAIDPDELTGLQQDLQALFGDWQTRSFVTEYWQDYDLRNSLLVGAEKAAEFAACNVPLGGAWPTPNSMRNVEPGTPFLLVEHLSNSFGKQGKPSA